MHLVVLDDDEVIASFMAAVASGSRLDGADSHHARDGRSRRWSAPRRRTRSCLTCSLAPATGSSNCTSCISEGYAGAIVLMSGFDARVLPSAQQIGDSLGLTIAAVLRSRRARRGSARYWRRSNAVRAQRHATGRSSQRRQNTDVNLGRRCRAGDRCRPDGVVSATDRVGRRAWRDARRGA